MCTLWHRVCTTYVEMGHLEIWCSHDLGGSANDIFKNESICIKRMVKDFFFGRASRQPFSVVWIPILPVYDNVSIFFIKCLKLKQCISWQPIFMKLLNVVLHAEVQCVYVIVYDASEHCSCAHIILCLKFYFVFLLQVISNVENAFINYQTDFVGYVASLWYFQRQF